jgi:hypothetical protein
MKNPTKYHSTQDVVAVACAIYREAGNKIVREGDDVSRDRLDMHFAKEKTVTVTDADRDMAETVMSYVQQQTTINALTGAKVSAFVAEVVAIADAPEISERNFGRIVWLPKLYADMVAKDDVKQDLAHYTVTSKYVGKIKDKMEIDFTPLTVKYSRDYNCYRHLGHDGHGNLIGFLSKAQHTGRIKGNIKRHATSTYHGNAKITYLNYVQGVK